MSTELNLAAVAAQYEERIERAAAELHHQDHAGMDGSTCARCELTTRRLADLLSVRPLLTGRQYQDSRIEELRAKLDKANRALDHALRQGSRR